MGTGGPQVTNPLSHFEEAEHLEEYVACVQSVAIGREERPVFGDGHVSLIRVHRQALNLADCSKPILPGLRRFLYHFIRRDVYRDIVDEAPSAQQRENQIERVALRRNEALCRDTDQGRGQAAFSIEREARPRRFRVVEQLHVYVGDAETTGRL